jgi:hypothetical protein
VFDKWRASHPSVRLLAKPGAVGHRCVVMRRENMNAKAIQEQKDLPRAAGYGTWQRENNHENRNGSMAGKMIS